MKPAAGRLLTNVLGGLVLVFMLAPLLIVLLASLDPGQFFQFPPRSVSFHWFHELLSREEWRQSLEFTLLIATLTALTATITGTLAGIALGRMAARRSRTLMPVVLAPLVVPPVVLAVAFYQLALRHGMTGSIVAFVATNAVLTAPVVTLFVGAAVRNLDPRLEFASLSAGASRLRTMMRIMAPLAAPAAFAGAAFSFLLTLDEVVVSSFLVAPDRVPVAVRMFQEVQHGTTPLVTAMASLIIVSIIVAALALTLARRLQETIYRAQSTFTEVVEATEPLAAGAGRL